MIKGQNDLFFFAVVGMITFHSIMLFVMISNSFILYFL